FPARRDLHSFPTRRSSDLVKSMIADILYPLQTVPEPSRRNFRIVEIYRILYVVLSLQRCLDSFPHAFIGDCLVQKPAVSRRELADRKSTRLNSSHVKISYA